MLSVGAKDIGFSSQDLPLLPAVAEKVLLQTADDAAGLAKIAFTISCDVSLASKILYYANSPACGYPRRIGTITQAVMILGGDTVRRLVLSFTLAKTFKRPEVSCFDHARFWERSLAMAMAAQRIADYIPEVNKEEAFLSGLLANLGELLQARLGAVENAVGSAAAVAAKRWATSEVADRRLLGSDHGKIGEEAAKRWNFPSFLADVMRCHGAPECLCDADPKSRLLVGLACLAETAVDMLYAGPSAHRAALFIERSRELPGAENILLHELIAEISDEVRQAAEFFGIHAKGRRTNDDILQESLLRLGLLNAGCDLKIRELEKAWDASRQENRRLEEKNMELESLANLDGLTQVYNHRFFQCFLRQEILRSARQGAWVGLVMMDVDDFKPLNDSYGHQVGDAILRELCQVARLALREYDMIARYGGEEFAVVLPGTELAEAQKIAERIRALVEKHEFLVENYRIRITLSIGVAALFPKPNEVNPGVLIGIADRSMLQAKSQGKNRVVVSPRPSSAASSA